MKRFAMTISLCLVLLDAGGQGFQVQQYYYPDGSGAGGPAQPQAVPPNP